MPCLSELDAPFSGALLASVLARKYDESEVLDGVGERPEGGVLLSDTSVTDADVEDVLLFRRPVKGREVRYKAAVMGDFDIWRKHYEDKALQQMHGSPPSIKATMSPAPTPLWSSCLGPSKLPPSSLRLSDSSPRSVRGSPVPSSYTRDSSPPSPSPTSSSFSGPATPSPPRRTLPLLRNPESLTIEDDEANNSLSPSCMVMEGFWAKLAGNSNGSVLKAPSMDTASTVF